MKNKAPLALIEILIMILIFALASAVCLKAFFWADHRSEQIEIKNEAVIAVQNTAEMLKYRNGDMQKFVEDEEGSWTCEEGIWICEYDDMYVAVSPEAQGTKGLSGAKVSAYSSEDEEIFSADVFWQTSLKGGGPDEN